MASIEELAAEAIASAAGLPEAREALIGELNKSRNVKALEIVENEGGGYTVTVTDDAGTIVLEVM